MKQATHQVSCQSLLLKNHRNFSAGLSIKRGSSRGFLQRFSSSSLNRSIYNFAFLNSRLLAQYACCRAVADIVPQCITDKCNVKKSSITVPVSDFFC